MGKARTQGSGAWRRAGGSHGRGWATIIALSVTLGQSATALAETGERWITDRLEVDLRRGQSNRHAITRMVPSGTAVELLEADKASGYSRVRTPSGAEGWLLSRYLLAEPPPRIRMPELQNKVGTMRQQTVELRSEAEDLRQERDELRQQLRDLEAAGAGLQKDLAGIRELSANTIAIEQENKRLREQLSQTSQRASALESENRQLNGQSTRNWFIAGAAVLGTGLVLGLVLPRIRWKRRSSWNRL